MSADDARRGERQPGSTDCDVAIVGYGPTGATLANLLGQAGLRVEVFEKASDVFPLPRAAHYDGETMRVFQSIGLMAEVERISRPGTKGMHFENATGQTLLVRTASEKPGPHGYANNWYFHQPDLERELRAGVARFRSVGVHLNHEVASVTQDVDVATLEVRDLRSGGERCVRTRYLVGCDGARSLVRQAIGGTREDLGLHQPWLCLDMLMKRDPGLPEYTIQLCDPARPMTIVNMAGRRRRWEIMLMPGDDPDTIADTDKVWPLLARWITPADADIERSAVYTFHSVIAHGWRKARLLIAGDAAHQTPPFLGQGMCAGIRDAANLAWKLVRVIARGADDALLDTYESERLPHVQAFIELAVRVGSIIQTTDPTVATERDRHFADSGPELFSYPVPQLGPGAHAGGMAPVATVFPQPRLADGRLLDDAVGERFALLVRSDARVVRDVLRGPRSDGSIRARLDDLGVVLLDAPGRTALEWMESYTAVAVLVRPDRYVAGIATNAGQIGALLRLIP